MFILNAITFISLVYILPGDKIFRGNISKIFGLSVLFCLILTLYFFLVWKGKYLEILKKYEEETKQDKIKG